MALESRKHWCRSIPFVLLLALGCGGSAPSAPTREEWFREKQEGVMTPSGPIDGASVHQDGDAVIYDAGSATLRQQYRDSPDGGYERVGDPVTVPRTHK